MPIFFTMRKMCHLDAISGQILFWLGTQGSNWMVYMSESLHASMHCRTFTRDSLSSVVQLCLTLCDPWTAVHQASLSITNSRAYSNSCPLSWWCCLIILSSVVPFSSCLQAFPASGSFPVSQFFTSGGQSLGVSASTSVLPMNIED